MLLDVLMVSMRILMVLFDKVRFGEVRSGKNKSENIFQELFILVTFILMTFILLTFVLERSIRTTFFFAQNWTNTQNSSIKILFWTQNIFEPKIC